MLDFFILCYNHSYKLKTRRAINLLTVLISKQGFHSVLFEDGERSRHVFLPFQ